GLADQQAEVQVDVFLFVRAVLEVPKQAHQLAVVDRLRQIRDRGPAQVLNLRFDAGVPRDQYDALDLELVLRELIEQLEAVAVGQHQIEQQHVRRLRIQDPPSVR